MLNDVADPIAGRWVHGLESILLGLGSTCWHEHLNFFIKKGKGKNILPSLMIIFRG